LKDITSSRRRAPLIALLVSLIAGLILFEVAAAARADGDPASDVLATQSLYLPQDAAASPVQQAQLTGLLAEARRAGYDVRVALIASPADLGSVTELWRRPRDYARFLGVELSLVYRGPLLVVMPNGLGFSGPGSSRGPPAGSAKRTGRAGGLAPVAMAAVRALAAGAGHPLRAPTATAAHAASGPGDVLPWLAFAAGLVMVAAAWSLSLRAKPAARGGRGLKARWR
jgi:hypothetical protein